MNYKQIFYTIFLTFVAGCALVVGIFFGLMYHQGIDLSRLEHIYIGKPSVLLDDQGNVWESFQEEKREDIALAELPQHLIDAFIAAEDHAFFLHGGISWSGIVRSALVNCYQGKIVQGASTITQQLVKLLFTDSQRTFKRKIKEQVFALLVERCYSKEQILQTYLNHIYFGAGLYGIEAACQRFWGISARFISIDQAATLAAIVKNPSHYCPIMYPLSAQKRRNSVLDSMKKLGFISLNDYTQASRVTMVIAPSKNKNHSLYVKEAIRLVLEPMFGKDKLYRGGLKIATTINQKMQEQMSEIFKNHVQKLRSKGLSQVNGGLISLEVETGHIKAMVGGYDFSESHYNRALQAKRQIGSIIKPLIYAQAVEQKISLTALADDVPLHLMMPHGQWSPRNSHRSFEGTMTLARALATSNNIISIKTLLAVGIEQVVSLVHKTRLSSDSSYYPSLALGCIDATVKNVAGMFNIFANNGRWIEPTFLKWVDESGKKLFVMESKAEQILSPLVAGQIASVMQVGIKRACRREGLSWNSRAALGKTGTTNDSRTVWFAGSTPYVTTVLYLGNDDNKPLGKNIFASRTAFPIWFDIYKKCDAQNRVFVYDSRLKECTIDGMTGESCEQDSPNALSLLMYQ